MLEDRFNRPLKKDDLVLMTTYSVYTDQLKYAIVENVDKNILFYKVSYNDYMLCEVKCSQKVFKVENPCEYEINLKNDLMKEIILQREQIIRYDKLKRKLPIGSIIINRTSCGPFLYLGKVSGMKTITIADEEKKDDGYKYFEDKEYVYISLFRDAGSLNELLYHKNDIEYIQNYFSRVITGNYSFLHSKNPKTNCYLLDKIDLPSLLINDELSIYHNMSNPYNSPNWTVKTILKY